MFSANFSENCSESESGRQWGNRGEIQNPESLLFQLSTLKCKFLSERLLETRTAANEPGAEFTQPHSVGCVRGINSSSTRVPRWINDKSVTSWVEKCSKPMTAFCRIPIKTPTRTHKNPRGSMRASRDSRNLLRIFLSILDTSPHTKRLASRHLG